jgi:hypothetical protein
MREPSKQLPENQQQFETVLVSIICDENPDIAPVILEQWNSAVDFGRWGSGAGFFTSFKVPKHIMPLPEMNHRVLEAYLLLKVGAPIDAEIAQKLGFDLETAQMNHVLATLHTNGSHIEELECASFSSGSAWPTVIYHYRVLANTAIQ